MSGRATVSPAGAEANSRAEGPRYETILRASDTVSALDERFILDPEPEGRPPRLEFLEPRLFPETP